MHRDVIWTSLRPKSAATCLFVCSSSGLHKNENIKAPRNRPVPVTDGFPSSKASDAESASMSRCQHDAYITTPCVVSHTPALDVVQREHPPTDYGTETTMQTGRFQELLLRLVIFAADISISDTNTGGSSIWKYICLVYNTSYDAIRRIVVVIL